jgi:hypothetical protein
MWCHGATSWDGTVSGFSAVAPDGFPVEPHTIPVGIEEDSVDGP